jgi:hypothetical protein
MSRKGYKQSPLGYTTDLGEQTNDGKEFNPEGSIFDYLIDRTVHCAFTNKFAPPFRLRFTDTNQKILRESILRMRKDKVWEQITFEGAGQAEFPISCRLTDRKGRQHEAVVSADEIESFMEEASTYGSRYIRFPAAQIPGFAPEVFLGIREMLAVSSLRGFEAPFTVEVRDADGELFGTAEIYADDDGEFRGGRSVADCAHIKFPVTIRLISQCGAGLAAIVERKQ